ncbi:type II toxin-antitoxin system HicB family antitoxin [Iodobacter arcticus]|uniref:Type II toxin-antitoxin system HicB family antitoxin n=1 Tax=Iodobacter arcticus TaxID=590593 RepID=A0ABW2QYQ8_9NEIS
MSLKMGELPPLMLVSIKYAGFIWGVVEMDVSRYLGKAEKINVTLPSLLIYRIDARTKNRSGWLAEAAIEKIARENRA